MALACYPLAVYARRRSKKIGDIYEGWWMLLVCILYVFALTILAEALLYRLGQTSFFSLALGGSFTPLIVFLAGVGQGLVYDYLGLIGLKVWDYPIVWHKRWLFWLVALFWGVFMFIMQDIYVIVRLEGLGTLAAFILTALIPMALIELLNFFTESWRYKGLLQSPFALALGWIVLAFTFVLGFNAFVLNPFGF